MRLHSPHPGWEKGAAPRCCVRRTSGGAVRRVGDLRCGFALTCGKSSVPSESRSGWGPIWMRSGALARITPPLLCTARSFAAPRARAAKRTPLTPAAGIAMRKAISWVALFSVWASRWCSSVSWWCCTLASRSCSLCQGSTEYASLPVHPPPSPHGVVHSLLPATHAVYRAGRPSAPYGVQGGGVRTSGSRFPGAGWLVPGAEQPTAPHGHRLRDPHERHARGEARTPLDHRTDRVSSCASVELGVCRSGPGALTCTECSSGSGGGGEPHTLVRGFWLGWRQWSGRTMWAPAYYCQCKSTKHTRTQCGGCGVRDAGGQGGYRQGGRRADEQDDVAAVWLQPAGGRVGVHAHVCRLHGLPADAGEQCLWET